MLLNTEKPEPLAALQWGGLRFRFDGNVAAGAAVLPILNEAMFAAMVYEDLLEGAAEFHEAIRQMMTLAQCFELLRDHPAYTRADRARWLEIFSGYADNLRVQVHEPTALETVWLGALNISAGVVLERGDWISTGLAIYRHAINDSVHPEGYLLGIVNAGDRHGLENQVSAVTALVLAAEAARHAGVDLWAHSARGVSVLTAAAYPLYYYFYPEKWPWDGGLSEEHVARIFHNCCGFLEIVNERCEKPLKAVRLLLDKFRPVYDCHGGGLTTLSHGLVQRGVFG